MAFKSDKQRKGFFATNPVKSISNLSFKARGKILDIQTKHAKAQQEKESAHLDKQIQKERELEQKEAVIAKKKAMLEKIQLDKELALQKAKAEQERILQSKRTSLQQARQITLTPEEQALLKASQERKRRKAEKREELRLKIRGGLIKGGKAVGRGVGRIGSALAEPEPPKRRRRKTSKRKRTRRRS